LHNILKHNSKLEILGDLSEAHSRRNRTCLEYFPVHCTR